MECHSSDSKNLIKVFDVSKRKKTRKKPEGHLDTTNSLPTDDSNHANNSHIMSCKASLQELCNVKNNEAKADGQFRERESSLSISHRGSKSPRRHRRATRDGPSLALKAGLASTPRSITPTQGGNMSMDVPRDQDSFIYTFLEEAIKRDKKRHHHMRKHEERHKSREREHSREHKHRHHRRREDCSRERDKQKRSVSPNIDQSALLETFAKLCVQMNDRNSQLCHKMARTQSHKSLQCETPRDDSRLYDDLRDPDEYPKPSRNDLHHPNRVRSQENCQATYPYPQNRRDNCCCYEPPKYMSKTDVIRRNEDERYAPHNVSTRTYIDYKGNRDYNRDYERKKYEDDKRRYIEQKTSRSFEPRCDNFDEVRVRRSARSEKDRRYDDKYFEKPIDSQVKDRRRLDKFDRQSVVSRDEFQERDRFSERERDSGLSVADCENSSVSGKCNYLRVVKQEIAEQREAMDKMMKLWKELMRCFKGISRSQAQGKSEVNESADSVRESAAAQLRLWRECMHRYETVARDVGDTDARLMEEINKQRSEMAEMATMWQECLQRYRDMSNDFKTLKQQTIPVLAASRNPMPPNHNYLTPEIPTRLPPAPLLCAEGEGSIAAPGYRVPPYHSMCMGGGGAGGAGGALGPGGGAVRGRASAPPWWWGAERRPSPRRRSSPESRGSRDRDRRDHRDRDRKHRHKDSRDDSRYKDKPKPSAARSEHRRAKR